MRDGFGKVIVSVENKDDPAASRIVWRKGSSFFPAEVRGLQYPIDALCMP